jgi:alpha-mannosidase
MLRSSSTIMLPLIIYLGSLFPQVTYGQPPAKTLWEIGKADRSNAEFALAPAAYREYREDGFFLVGESDPRRDWPYVQPGPADSWAGTRRHTFTIRFGLKNAPPSGSCRLNLDLLDSHSLAPPRLRIEINGHPFERALGPGGGDASIDGRPEQGKPAKVAVKFPAELLRSGDNEIRITTLEGSWMLYDGVRLTVPEGAELSREQARTFLESLEAPRALKEQASRTLQPVVLNYRHYGEDREARVRLDGGFSQPLRLKAGRHTVELFVPPVSAPTQQTVRIEIDGKETVSKQVTLKPVRKVTVYVLPHSHTDIGYTEIQTAIEKKQVDNLIKGIEIARKTANYPEGARLVWNVEVLWAADLYLQRLDEKHRADFFDAVKKGQVVLNGMYLNELTGLCRPEELVQLFRYATKLSEKTGRKIDSVMISDVPGYTWGTVTAMAQAGIRYFSTAPNYGARIGTIMRDWENKPFYWVGPDGKSKVLVWIPYLGYGMSHLYKTLSPKLVDDFLEQLDQRDYPYDIAHMRWSGHGDNAVPDPTICEFVKDWNAKYTWPHFIISGTSEAFHAMEERYGEKLPRVRGDWTPYWEDGAGSSALETAMNRQSSDRLVQAETLCVMRGHIFDSKEFEKCWDKVLLYSEHTWGAYCSTSEPENPLTLDQWKIKRGYALDADKDSQLSLFMMANMGLRASPSPVDVFNTLSWPRSELVTISASQSSAGDRVSDEAGKPVPSQRLTSGELMFLAKDIPPFASRSYTILAGAPLVEKKVKAERTVLDNGVIRVRVDEKTGGIVELTARGIDGNFVDAADGQTLNEYLYLIGDDLKDLQHNGPVKIRPGEKGPLVASLIVESAAPGCRRLTREVRLTAGRDDVELIDTVDKERLQAKNYNAKAGKESVNFGFPFAVPGGQFRLDIPLGMMRPEIDQMPSACKNWLTAGRFADVSNAERGITWVTLDAPLVQLGGITARFMNSGIAPELWQKTIEPTQKLYCWAMNNHWDTNYRAYQEGPVVFRFALQPHGPYRPIEAARLAIGLSQPLVAAAVARGPIPTSTPLLRLNNDDVLVTALKPSDDGKAWIVRLFGAGGKPAKVKITWSPPRPKAVWLSDTSQRPLQPVQGEISVPAWGLVTLYAEK